MAERECTKKLLSVEINAAEKEYLLYVVSAKGAQAVFALVDENDQVIFSHADGDPGQNIYQRKWPLAPGELPNDDETTHTMAFHFITAQSYSYRVTHHRKDGSVIAELKNCKYTGKPPRDTCFEPLHVDVVR